jgi:hypothetical protein
MSWAQCCRAPRVRLSKEYAELTPVVQAIDVLDKARAERRDLEALAGDPEADPEVAKMAEEELQDLRRRLPMLERQVQLLLLPRDEADAATRSSRSGPAPAAMRRRCSRPICSACTSAMRRSRNWKFEMMDGQRDRHRRLQGGDASIRAATSSQGSSSNPACTGCSGCRRPRRAGASTRRPPPSRCCPRPKKSTSRSTKRICASTSSARAAPAASR